MSSLDPFSLTLTADKMVDSFKCALSQFIAGSMLFPNDLIQVEAPESRVSKCLKTGGPLVSFGSWRKGTAELPGDAG